MAEPNRRIADLIEEWEPALRKAFLAGVAQIRDRAQITLVAECFVRGDIEGALRAVGIDPGSFRALESTIAQAFEDGGDFVMGRIPALRQPDGHRLNVLFSTRNLRAETWLKEHSSALVAQIVDDQRAMVRQHLTAGMMEGANPRTVALDLVGRINPTTRQREGGTIGLTASQEGWVRRYVSDLAAGSPEALKRTLRDRRFDRTVQKAIREGAPIPAETQAKMVAAYRTRALRHRAEMLARTEAMTALHASQDEAFQQAVEAGQVERSRVYKIWHSAADGRVRHSHRRLSGQRVPFDGTFVSESGAQLRFPGDPNAPASEIVGCRCWMSTRIDHWAR